MGQRAAAADARAAAGDDIPEPTEEEAAAARRMFEGMANCERARLTEEARRKAERLGPLRPAVVAFSATADTELGDYDENPNILFKSGRLPFPFSES